MRCVSVRNVRICGLFETRQKRYRLRRRGRHWREVRQESEKGGAEVASGEAATGSRVMDVWLEAFCFPAAARRLGRLLGTFKQFLRFKQLLVKFSRAARFRAKDRGVSKTVPNLLVTSLCMVTHASGALSEISVCAASRAAGHLRPTKAWRGPAVFSPPDLTSMVEGAGVLEEEKPASLSA